MFSFEVLAWRYMTFLYRNESIRSINLRHVFLIISTLQILNNVKKTSIHHIHVVSLSLKSCVRKEASDVLVFRMKEKSSQRKKMLEKAFSLMSPKTSMKKIFQYVCIWFDRLRYTWGRWVLIGVVIRVLVRGTSPPSPRQVSVSWVIVWSGKWDRRTANLHATWSYIYLCLLKCRRTTEQM